MKHITRTLLVIIPVLLMVTMCAKISYGQSPTPTGGMPIVTPTTPPVVRPTTPPVVNPSTSESKPILTALSNPIKGVNSISGLVYMLAQVALDIGYVLIAIFLLLSGFKFVTAQGSEDKLTDAKNTFKYTIIGALIIIGAQTIIAVVKSIMAGLGIA